MCIRDSSYGIPMILPMMYFSWRNAGRYELKVDMSSGMKVSVATWLNKKLKLEPVSYTHLDVYKRQEVCPVIQCGNQACQVWGILVGGYDVGYAAHALFFFIVFHG